MWQIIVSYFFKEHQYHSYKLIKWNNQMHNNCCTSALWNYSWWRDLEFSTHSSHERRTLLSLAHFLRARMMYSTWGFPEFRSRDNTSFSVSLEHKDYMWGNKMRSRMHHISFLFVLDTHKHLICQSRCFSLLLGNARDPFDTMFCNNKNS